MRSLRRCRDVCCRVLGGRRCSVRAEAAQDGTHAETHQPGILDHARAAPSMMAWSRRDTVRERTPAATTCEVLGWRVGRVAWQRQRAAAARASARSASRCAKCARERRSPLLHMPRHHVQIARATQIDCQIPQQPIIGGSLTRNGAVGRQPAWGQRARVVARALDLFCWGAARPILCMPHGVVGCKSKHP